MQRTRMSCNLVLAFMCSFVRVLVCASVRIMVCFVSVHVVHVLFACGDVCFVTFRFTEAGVCTLRIIRRFASPCLYLSSPSRDVSAQLYG